jgi:hypothetical protein
LDCQADLGIPFPRRGNWQTSQKRHSKQALPKALALPSEAPETTDFSNLPRDLGNSACTDMQGLSAPNPKQLPATAQRQLLKEND